GIAANSAPRGSIICQHQDQTDAGENPSPVVKNVVPQEIVLARRIDSFRGNFSYDSQSLARRKATRGVNRQAAERAEAAAPIAAARAHATGVRGPAHRPAAGDEVEVIARLQNWKAPEIACDIPIELRPAFEPTNLPAGAIPEDISVVASGNVAVLV